VNHPKEVDCLINKIEMDLKELDEMVELQREVGMMHAARKTPTPNELIEEEIDAIERMKRDRVVNI